MRVEARGSGTLPAQVQANQERSSGVSGKRTTKDDIAVTKVDAVAPKSDQSEAERLSSEAEKRRLEQQVQDINKALQSFDRRVQVEKHETTGAIMVKVIDTTSNEVVREIPPERILDVVGSLMQGLLVDQKA